MTIQYSEKIDRIIYSGIFNSMTQEEKIDLIMAILDQSDIDEKIQEQISEIISVYA